MQSRNRDLADDLVVDMVAGLFVDLAVLVRWISSEKSYLEETRLWSHQAGGPSRLRRSHYG